MLRSRRSFIWTAAAVSGAAAGSAAFAGVGTAAAASGKIPTVELMKIGVIACGEYSHMDSRGSIWAPAINPTEPERWPMRTSRMLITHCWDRDPEIAAEFGRRYACEPVKRFDDMVDKVDAMIFAGFYEVKWWPQLTRPYLEAGIPCFINRPFAFSMAAAKEMVERSIRCKAPILSIDAHEDMEQGLLARQKVLALVNRGDRIVAATSTNQAGEWPAHGVHGLYLLTPVFGTDVEQVSFQAPGWWSEPVATSPRAMSWAVLSLVYRGIDIGSGKRQDQPFVVTQQHFNGTPTRATLRIYFNSGWEDFDHKRLNESPDSTLIEQRYYLQSKTVFDMQRMFETREMPFSHDYILAKTRIFLAAFKSHLDHNGGMVRPEDVPDNWEAPCPYPDWIDESIFS